MVDREGKKSMKEKVKGVNCMVRVVGSRVILGDKGGE